MSKQVSPFAALTGAEKQIRWMEYQSIRLPYVEAHMDESVAAQSAASENTIKQEKSPTSAANAAMEWPQPPPEVPRTMPADYQKSRHSQYDAVIARLKQAELQSRRYASQTSQ